MTRAFHAGTTYGHDDKETPAISAVLSGSGETAATSLPSPEVAEARKPRSSSGLGCRPFTAVAAVQIRSGVLEKTCITCGEAKPLDGFYADKSRADGRTKKCAPCLREYNRQYRRKNNTTPNGPDYLVDAATGCWVWQKYIAPDGYGEMRFESRAWAAHRWFYTQHVGEIPEDTLHHECANKICVNPAHLTPMSYSDHARLEWQIRKGVAA